MKAAGKALGAAIVAVLAITRAQAQAPQPPDGPRYVATYVDVMPTREGDGAALVRQFRDASRKETGNLRLEAAHRIGQANQFVILEAWQDQAALDAHAKAAHTTAFRDKLKAIQDAPYDERVNYVLSVGALPAEIGGAAILTVTHVDVVPPQKDMASALLKQLAEDSRKDDGNLRFEATTQLTRPNHFTVITAWRNAKAFDAHIMNAKTRAFRDQLAPASGALYDERLYKALD
jgi:quinol monooxygenase YgiN